GIQVLRRKFSPRTEAGRDHLLQQLRTYFAPMSRVKTAEFQIVGLEELPGSEPNLRVDIRYDLVGLRGEGAIEERVGNWQTHWSQTQGTWRVLRWEASEEILSSTRQPAFIDITRQALGSIESYRRQMVRGVDHWRTVLDGACGIEVYGNNGVAAGDF